MGKQELMEWGGKTILNGGNIQENSTIVSRMAASHDGGAPQVDMDTDPRFIRLRPSKKEKKKKEKRKNQFETIIAQYENSLPGQ